MLENPSSTNVYKNQLIITAATIFIAVVSAVLLSVVLVKSMITSDASAAVDQQVNHAPAAVTTSTAGNSCVEPNTQDFSASTGVLGSSFGGGGHGVMSPAVHHGTSTHTNHHNNTSSTNHSSTTHYNSHNTTNTSTSGGSQSNSQQNTTTSTGLVNVANGALSNNNTNIASFNQDNLNDNLNDLLDLNLLNGTQAPLVPVLTSIL